MKISHCSYEIISFSSYYYSLSAEKCPLCRRYARCSGIMYPANQSQNTAVIISRTISATSIVFDSVTHKKLSYKLSSIKQKNMHLFSDFKTADTELTYSKYSNPGTYSPKLLVGVSDPNLKTLLLFEIKICDS